MKMIKYILMTCLPLFMLASFALEAQTSRTRSGTTTFGRDQRRDDDRETQIRDFIVALVGGQLRHPDPEIRKQAVLSIASGIAEGGRTGTTRGQGGIREFFTVGESGGRSSRDSASVGSAAYVPDFFVLLYDADPEVRDFASVGLDAMFGTEMTLTRFMEDPDPEIRNYATQIYTMKSFTGERTGSRTQQDRDVNISEMLAVRSMLVRLRYEQDPAVRKSVVDSLEWYIKHGSTGDRTTRRDEQSGRFGVDVAILEYLDDPNPEIRLHAVRIISDREHSDSVLIKLIERLRIEDNDRVKEALRDAIQMVRYRGLPDGDRRRTGAGQARTREDENVR